MSGMAGMTPVYQFTASSDLVPPVIVHTPLADVPKVNWPPTVTASVTDNIGIDSVWVKWYKNTPATLSRQFKLLPTTGTNFAAAFNSINSEVSFSDSIFYRVFARDNSSNHNADSSALYKFKIISLTTITIGTGSVGLTFPFATFWHDGRSQFIYKASEIIAGGGCGCLITKIGFQVSIAAPATMNGFNISMKNTTDSVMAYFDTSGVGWTNVYSTPYAVPGTGWITFDLTTPFAYNPGKHLMIEICFDNTAYTTNTTVLGFTTTAQEQYNRHLDNSTGCIVTYQGYSYTPATAKPNIQITQNTLVGVNNNTTVTPGSFNLAQNYPNPFNPVTQIRFDIPKQSFVTLKVYDILGREVSNLVNEMRSPGSYLVDFNATSLSSGVYFYRLQAGSFESVKRMVLVK